jgi:hypothetical protein
VSALLKVYPPPHAIQKGEGAIAPSPFFRPTALPARFIVVYMRLEQIIVLTTKL